MFSIVN